jgi:chromosome partitioning protein
LKARIVAFENSKGGVAKTTSSIAVADAAAVAGRHVALVDADSQGSAMDWYRLAAQTEFPLRVKRVLPLPTDALGRHLVEHLKDDEDLVIIDGPPALGPTHEAVIASADLLVVPTPPQRACIQRVATMAQLAEKYHVPLVIVFTLVRTGIDDVDGARALLVRSGLTVLTTELKLSVHAQRSYGYRPVGSLAAFGRDLWAELAELPVLQESRS